MYICTHIFIYMYTYMYMFSREYNHVSYNGAFVYVYMCTLIIFIDTYAHTHIHAHIQTHISCRYECMHVCIHAYMYVCMHMYDCAYIHIYTHSHTPTNENQIYLSFDVNICSKGVALGRKILHPLSSNNCITGLDAFLGIYNENFIEQRQFRNLWKPLWHFVQAS